MTCMQEVTALVGALNWWQVFYVFPAAFLWSLATIAADELVNALWPNRFYSPHHPPRGPRPL